MTDQPLNLDGWRDLQPQTASLPGQQLRPGVDAQPLVDVPRHERKDRRRGQIFLFDSTRE